MAVSAVDTQAARVMFMAERNWLLARDILTRYIGRLNHQIARARYGCKRYANPEQTQPGYRRRSS